MMKTLGEGFAGLGKSMTDMSKQLAQASNTYMCMRPSHPDGARPHCSTAGHCQLCSLCCASKQSVVGGSCSMLYTTGGVCGVPQTGLSGARACLCAIEYAGFTG